MKTKNRISILLMSIIFIFVLMYSASASSLSIITSHTEVFKLNSDASLVFHIFNSSGTILNASKSEVNCSIAIYNESSWLQYQGELTSVSNLDYSVRINSSTIGLYSFDVWCLSSKGESGWRSDYYYVSREGMNYVPGNSSMTPIVIILGIFAICFLLLYTAFKLDKDKHFILQLIILVFVIIVSIMIPKTILNYTGDYSTSLTFFKAVMWFIRVFWAYLFFYLLSEIFTPLKNIRLRFRK